MFHSYRFCQGEKLARWNLSLSGWVASQAARHAPRCLKYKESWVSNNNPMLSPLLLSNCKILITYILFTCILFTCLLFTCLLFTCTHTHMLTFICPHITGILTCLLFTCTLLITSTPLSYSHTHHMYTPSMYAHHILTHHLHAHHIIKICILHTQLQGKMPGWPISILWAAWIISGGEFVCCNCTCNA